MITCKDCIHYPMCYFIEQHERDLETDEPCKNFVLDDIVEVVRCKDCKHYEIHKPSVLENCERNGAMLPMKPSDFCSYGERKDGADNE